MYTNYEFYINKYYGNVISADDFPKYEDKASNKLYQLTMGRIEEVMALDKESRVSNLIQKAICDIAEKMYDIDTANNIFRRTNGLTEENGQFKGKVITSISAGAESISFSTQSNTSNNIQALISMTPRELEHVYFECAREYLGMTGLLSQAL